MKLPVIYCSALSIFFSSMPAFSTMIGKDKIALSTDCSGEDSFEHIKVQNDKKNELLFNISDLSIFSQIKPREESEFDVKLKALKGKNLSQAPLSEEMYKFIERKVGSFNQRPFVFNTGPQIIFEDEIDLSK